MMPKALVMLAQGSALRRTSVNLVAVAGSSELQRHLSREPKRVERLVKSQVEQKLRLLSSLDVNTGT
jgi:hypothetical protein